MGYCKRCVTPSTRPRIGFRDGICNACHWHDYKKNIIDWDHRKTLLYLICEEQKKKNGQWDCIIPVSGGKDSTTIAYKFKHEYGMNPLTITFAHPIPTRIGWQNWNNFVQTGFDNILITPDQKKYRKYAKDWFIKAGFPKQPFVVGISSALIKYASKFNIGLIVYAEQGEAEYGGKKETSFLEKFDRNFLINIYYEGQSDSEDYGAWWQVPSEKDLENIYVTWYSLFENWDPEENAKFASQHLGMEMHVGGNIGTFTNYAQNEDHLQDFHCFMGYIKHGFSRATSDISIEIRQGRMSRDEGVKLANKIDGQFPIEHLDKYLDYFEMTEPEFWEVIDKHANKDLLVKTSKVERPYILKEPVK